MAEDWVTRIGPYKVEKREGPRPNGAPYLPRMTSPSFCVHSTEGSTVDGAVATLRSKFFAPHFVVGENRIVQMRPLWAQGATLRTHNERFVQVECVGFAKQELHELTPATWEPLKALTRFVRDELGVPLYRPWPDLLPPFPASDNPRRRDGFALTRRGVYGHVDVPDQDPTWHWDPGSLRYSKLFAEIESEDDDVKFDEFQAGWKDARDGKPQEPGASKAYAFGYRAYNDAQGGGGPSQHTHEVTSAGKGKTVTSGPAKV